MERAIEETFAELQPFADTASDAGSDTEEPGTPVASADAHAEESSAAVDATA